MSLHVAQLVEHLSTKQTVDGSIPSIFRKGV